MDKNEQVIECDTGCKNLAEIGRKSYDNNRILVECARIGDLATIKCLVQNRDADINYGTSPSGYSVLHIAAMNGQTEVVKYLISNGADVDNLCVNIFKETALSVAIKGGHIGTAKALIKRGAKTNITDEDLWSMATQSNNPRVIRFVLRDVLRLKGLIDKNGTSIELLRASRGAFNRSIKYLVKVGADTNYRDQFDMTPLAYAIENAHIETAKLLVELGAKTPMTYDDLWRIEFRAVNPEMIEFVWRELLGIDEFHENHPSIEFLKASREGFGWPIDKLLKLGAHINYEDEHGMTALAYAVQNGHIVIAKLLIELGANTDIDINGTDLLMLAVESRQLEIIRYVSRDVLGIRKSDPSSSKALHKAASLGLDWPILSELIEVGADIDYKSADGSTPLIAAQRNRHQVVEKLLQLLASVDRKFNGSDLADIAFEMEHFDLIDLFATNGAQQFASSKDIRESQIFKSTDAVKWLVSNGANIDIGIDENDTALSRVVHGDNIQMARTLIELGAKTDIGEEGKNLLDIAIDRSNPEMIELLLDAGLRCEKRDSKDRNLNSAMAVTSRDGYSIALKYLVSIGADVNYQIDEHFSPPLFNAAYFGHIETAKLLIGFGANTNIEVNGENLLDMAICSDSKEMVEMALKHGSFDINGLNPRGKPYLSVAMENASANHRKLVDYFLEKGADIWVLSEPDKRSALWFCRCACRAKVACRKLLYHVKKNRGKAALIKYMNFRDTQGQTVLHLYANNGDKELLELLLSLGADPNIKDAKHRRPLDVTESEEIKKLLISYKK